MKIDKCVQCGHEPLNSILDTVETVIDNKTLVIPNVEALQCPQCNEIYYDKDASVYIDKQIAIFKAEGFENRINEFRKLKNLTLEQFGELLGVTKQRAYQIMQDSNPDVRTMYKLSNAIGEPIQNVFSFNHILQKGDKFYISK